MTTEPTPTSPREAGSKGPNGTNPQPGGGLTRGPNGTKPQPGGGLTSMELRCYAITVLAVVSIVSWRVITAGAASSADPGSPPLLDPPAISRSPTPAAPAELDDVARPSYTVPAGWHLVGWDPARPTPSRRSTRVTSPPTVVRAPEPSAPRVVRAPAQPAPTVVRAPAPRKKLVRAPASRRVRTRSS